ncbi:MAG TPA: thioredoxin domain-containing protein [Gaiellaceae bacterium]|nr:thioredoxin domain-containing protein [Gaiellaceae bacterium]
MTRNQRLLVLGGFALATVVAVALAVSLGSSSKPAAAPVVASYLANIPQHGDVLGKTNAPATLVVFEDPQCPYCRVWSLDALPAVVTDFVKTGRVKLAWRGIPIVGDNSVDGLRAAYAAGEQNRLWNLVDQLYQRQGSENSGWITASLLKDSAVASGIDASRMLENVNASGTTSAMRESLDEAQRAGIHGTPSFVLVTSSGSRPLNVTGLDSGTFCRELAAALP